MVLRKFTKKTVFSLEHCFVPACVSVSMGMQCCRQKDV